MENLMIIIAGVFEIMILDMVLSADNIGVIALATKNLPSEYAKRASIAGITGAVGLRIFFASVITYIMMVQWLPIKLVGGLLLIKITWDLIKPQQKEEEETSVKVTNRFWGAVTSIIIADVSMSLDNVLAIAGTANGNVIMIIFGIMLNIPILFFGSKVVGRLMKKYQIVVYIGGAILAHTSVKMVFEDKLLLGIVPHQLAIVFSLSAAALTMLYGMHCIKKTAKESTHSLEKSA